MRSLSTFALLVCLLGHAAGAEGPEPKRVSIIGLVATPTAFDGARVYVEGVLDLRFEGNALYLHKEDRDYRVAMNAVWLDVSKEQRTKWAELNGRHVLVVGRADAKLTGHFAAYPSGLRDIERIEPLKR